MRLVKTPQKPTDCCPPRKTLMQFLQGRLPESRIQMVEEHVICCPSCGDTIRNLDSQSTSDDLAKMIASSDNSLQDQDSPHSADRQQVDALIDRLQALNLHSDQPHAAATNHHDTNRDAATRAKEVTLLLGKSDHKNHLGRVAHYEVTHLLGSGGTGIVYKAIDTQLQRPVALKILRPSVGVAARKRFLSEARSAARIDHEQVITIYNVGEENELAYIAMQWLPGETLESQLQRERTLGNELAQDIFRQVALGLAAAHDQGLIHRDIKPANIWIEQDGGRVKILDFGLARVADDDPQFTETGMIAGTPTFMSPEQARGGQVDCRSDLFSLGCVLYRMIAGQLPFQAANVLATLQSIQRFTPPAPKELNPGVTDHLNDLALCLLEKNADLRPQSAVSVLHALETESSKWDFTVQESKSVRIKKETKPPTSVALTKPKPARSSGLRGWILAGLAFALLSAGCYLFGPQIIRISTGKALVTIETSDDDVQIEVLQDGKVIKLLDNQTNQSIEIKEGNYQLQAMGKGNSVSISPEQLTLTRGDKQIVTVKVQPATSTKPIDSSLNPQATPAVDEVMVARAIDDFLVSGQSNQDLAKFHEKTQANVDKQLLPEFMLHAVKAVMLEQELAALQPKASPAYAAVMKRKLIASIEKAITCYDTARKDPKWALHLSHEGIGDMIDYLSRRNSELRNPEIGDPKFVPSYNGDQQPQFQQPNNQYPQFGQPTNQLPQFGQPGTPTQQLQQPNTPIVLPGAYYGDQQVQPAKALPQFEEQAQPAKAIELTYEGKNLAYWIRLANSERSENKCGEILSAMGALGEAPQSQTILDSAFIIFRHSDYRSVLDDSSFLKMLLRLNPEIVTEKLIDELNEGNALSHYAVAQMLGLAYSDRELSKALTKPKTTQRLLEEFESSIQPDIEKTRWREDFLVNLYWCGIGAKVQVESIHDRPVQDSVLDISVRQRIAKHLNRFRNRKEISSRTENTHRILKHEKIGIGEIATDYATRFWITRSLNHRKAHAKALSSMAENGSDVSPAVEYLANQLKVVLDSDAATIQNSPYLQTLALFQSLESDAKAALPILLEIEPNIAYGKFVRNAVRQTIKSIDKHAFESLPKRPRDSSASGEGGSIADAGGPGLSGDGPAPGTGSKDEKDD